MELLTISYNYVQKKTKNNNILLNYQQQYNITGFCK